jgi:4-aminobutyrate aminotransferase
MSQQYGPEASKVVSDWDQNVAPSVAKHPVSVVPSRAKGIYIYDVDGNKIADFSSGIASLPLGHGHPEVIAAAKEQIDRFVHVCSHTAYYQLYVDLIKSLRRIAPPCLKDGMGYLGNSGGEAVEAALKLVRYSTRKPLVLAYVPSFHGRTTGALSITAADAKYRKNLQYTLANVVHIPYPYCYRCPMGNKYSECDIACLSYVENYILKMIADSEDIAALVMEPISGEPGYIIPPDEYVRRLTKVLASAKISLIADEIQTGIGRTGKWFAVEHWSIEPAVMTIAKALGSGFPISAILGQRELMTEWKKGAHGSTFGGNPVAAAAAIKTIEVMERDKVVQNAERVGNHLLKRLSDLVEHEKNIGDVRGKGLAIAVELVENKDTKVPAVELRNKTLGIMLKKGLYCIGAGASAVRFAPPLVITPEDADNAVEIFQDSLETASVR